MEAKGCLPSSIDDQATIQEPSLISESSITLLLLSLDGPFTFHYQIPQPYQWCCGVLADPTEMCRPWRLNVLATLLIVM